MIKIKLHYTSELSVYGNLCIPIGISPSCHVRPESISLHKEVKSNQKLVLLDVL